MEVTHLLNCRKPNLAGRTNGKNNPQRVLRGENLCSPHSTGFLSQWRSFIHFLLFIYLYALYLRDREGRDGETEKQVQRDLSLLAHSPNNLHNQSRARLNVTAQTGSVLPHGMQDSHPWVIICLFPTYILSTRWNYNGRGQDKNKTLEYQTQLSCDPRNSLTTVSNAQPCDKFLKANLCSDIQRQNLCSDLKLIIIVIALIR